MIDSKRMYKNLTNFTIGVASKLKRHAADCLNCEIHNPSKKVIQAITETCSLTLDSTGDTSVNSRQESSIINNDVILLDELPIEILEIILKIVVLCNVANDTEGQQKQMREYKNLTLVWHKFSDSLNHPDFLSKSVKRKWS